MQDLQASIRLGDLPLEDQQRLVGVFVWLIEEDKKQNPALYEPIRKEDD